MKTAISIPDAIFRKAEAFANQRGMSRSQLFTAAVVAFVAEHGKDGITALLDRVYTTESSGVDDDLASAQDEAIGPGTR